MSGLRLTISKLRRLAELQAVDLPPSISLLATMRPRRVSRAFHTSPMSPAPMGARISYGPSLAPDFKVIAMLRENPITFSATAPSW
jgi:hypothetical protein